LGAVLAFTPEPLALALAFWPQWPRQESEPAMTNMGYNRFRNTVADLRDCYEHIHDPLIAGSRDGEHAARIKLVELCERILEECGVPADRPWEIVEHAEQEEALPVARPPGQS
jgi:hypothetical protein